MPLSFCAIYGACLAQIAAGSSLLMQWISTTRRAAARLSGSSNGPARSPMSASWAELEKCDIVCANCHRARTHARAMEGRQLRIEAGHTPIIESRRRREQTALMQKLRDVPCADCQERFPFFAMDFDHRDPTKKSFELTRMLGRLATERLLEEATKCDIVCANCHRARTYLRRIARAGVA